MSGLILPPHYNDKVVNTSDPEALQRLTADDERRLDRNGRPAVEGLPWGKAQSPLWLMVGVVVNETKSTIKVPETGDWNIMQLPSDLMADRLKVAYVGEWALTAAGDSVVKMFRRHG